MDCLNALTQREYEVLICISQGQQNKEIALALHIAVHTVEQHLKHIYRKLGIGNRTEASVIYWRDNNTSSDLTGIRYIQRTN
jgi:DNA-binding CsgD family transcriptional regulator